MASLAFGFVRFDHILLLARDRDVRVLLGPFCTRGYTPLIVSSVLIKLMSLSSGALPEFPEFDVFPSVSPNTNASTCSGLLMFVVGSRE